MDYGDANNLIFGIANLFLWIAVVIIFEMLKLLQKVRNNVRKQ